MIKARLHLLELAFFLCIGLSSCSQPPDQSVFISFEATTPCSDEIKVMMSIPQTSNCEMIKWDLTIYKVSKKIGSDSFHLRYTYGLPKQGTRGFTNGAVTGELKGKSISGKGINGNMKANTYTLITNDSAFSLSFFQPDDNLLHLLTPDKKLFVGNAAWSYTLNRKLPVPSSSNKHIPQAISSPLLNSHTDTVGVFEGRTPCYHGLTELNEISTDGCQLIKCQLILLQDAKTNNPADFVLHTVYVGKGNTKYRVTGKWKIMRGNPNDPAAIIFLLEFNTSKAKTPLMLSKADDNILYILDHNSNFLVGNAYCSYTLNRDR